MITLVASTRRATAVSDDAITTRSVGIPVTLDLSEHFDGLAVTLVCKAGEVSRDIAVLDPDALEVPVDCLQVAGVPLLLGLVGKNTAGTIVIRTTMASAGTIRVGTEESDVDPSDPVPDWTAQVQQAAAEAVATANSVRTDADAGAFDGADGYSPTATVEQLADGATISITDKDGTTTATIHDGADGATGPEGPAGYSPSARVTQTASGATITVTDQSGTTTADISNGAPGEPGQTGPIGPTGEDGFSPTVDVQPITGGHEVTITDADGAHSFEVMDGDPSAPGSITDEMLAPDGIKPQVAQLWGNQLTGTMSGTIATAADTYAAPPMALTVEGASTQAGTPTPDAPVPILSVDDLALAVAEKNILDEANNIVRGYFYANTPKISAGGTSIYAPIVGGETYTVSGGNGNRRSMNFTEVLPEVDVALLGGTDLPNNYSAQTFTAPANAKYVIFYIDSTSDKTPSGYQLEAGSTATAYTPYVEPTTVPDLLPEGTSLRSLPDGTKDTLALTYLRPSTRPGWAWYGRELVQRVEKFVAMSASGWNKSSSAINGYYKLVANVTSGRGKTQAHNGIMAPWFKAANSQSDYFNTLNACWVDNSINFNIDPDVFSGTASEFGQWVAEHNIEFYMPLATPTITTLDPIELPTLPAPNCTVWCDGGSAQPTYSMEYVQDTNIVIADLRAALADLATS